MIPILADSDILIEVIRGRNVSIEMQWSEIAESEQQVFVSPASIAELWQGVRPHESKRLEEFLETLICIPIGKETGQLAGHYLNRYRKSHNVGIADALIAAGAVLEDAHLWTRNRKHYPMPELSFY